MSESIKIVEKNGGEYVYTAVKTDLGWGVNVRSTKDGFYNESVDTFDTVMGAQFEVLKGEIIWRLPNGLRKV